MDLLTPELGLFFLDADRISDCICYPSQICMETYS